MHRWDEKNPEACKRNPPNTGIKDSCTCFTFYRKDKNKCLKERRLKSTKGVLQMENKEEKKKILHQIESWLTFFFWMVHTSLQEVLAGYRQN